MRSLVPLALFMTLGLGIGYGTVQLTASTPDAPASVEYRQSATGDTATVTVTWEPRAQAVEYLVEWWVGGETTREVWVNAPAVKQFAQTEEGQTGSACVWAINRGGKLSGEPSCRPIEIPASWPLVAAPEGVEVEVEVAPDILWDSIRVYPASFEPEALGEEQDLFAYLFSGGEPFACVTMTDGALGWAMVSSIRADGSPVFADVPLFTESACGVTFTSTDPETVEVLNPGPWPVIRTAPGQGA